MKKLLFFILLLTFSLANATVVDSMFVIGADYKLIHILNKNNSGYVYAENNQYEKILIYQSPYPYLPSSIFSSDQIEDTDILDIGFDCDNKNTCSRFFNRQTNALSDVYDYVIEYNAKKDIVVFYLADKGLVVISRAFQSCKKPFTYPIKLHSGYYFGFETRFLPNGNLKLDYNEFPNNNYKVKIISIDYPKLFAQCSGKS